MTAATPTIASTSPAKAATAPAREPLPGEAVHIVLPGTPRTKKNSQRLIRRGGAVIPIPSAAFAAYQAACGAYLKPLGIARPVNVCCVFYMPTRRRVDLVNLLAAADDILTHYGVIVDDRCTIVTGHDGSRVARDSRNPRAEITITPSDWRWEE